MTFSNHMIDPKTKGIISIDPATRRSRNFPDPAANPSSTRGFTSSEARRGAASIFERNQVRTKLGNSTSSGTRGAAGKQGFGSRRNDLSSFGGRGGTVRPPPTNYGIGRSQAGIGSRNMGDRSLRREGSFGKSSGMGSGSPMGGRSFGEFRGGSGGLGSQGFSGGGSRR